MGNSSEYATGNPSCTVRTKGTMRTLAASAVSES